MARFLALLTVGFVFAGLSSGCDGGGGADGGADSAADTGPSGACAGQPDGTSCGNGGDTICVDGACVESSCGDGFLDTRSGEECDDMNTTAFDGCEPDTCTFTCDADTDCDDAVECNGEERCSVAHVCEAGTPLIDGSTCADGVCRDGTCVEAGCGNGVVDTGSAEHCDDMNTVDRDGCEDDCRFTCEVDPSMPNTWYVDCDADGYASVGAPTNTECLMPSATACGGGWTRRVPVAGTADCLDTNAAVRPGVPEVCDTVDNDCNGTIDDGVATTYYRDTDGDGYGAPGTAMIACTMPADHVANSDDCQDGNAGVHPAAAELCDRLDNDCSSGGGADFAEDADGDLHAPSAAGCSGGYPRDDCDDGAASVYTGATEVCDGVDNNCSSGGGPLASEDADGDFHAPPAAACLGGPYARNDCDDANDVVYAGALEVCDGLDNDCSLGGGPLAAEDADGDMHSAPAAACSGGFMRDDCDDTSATVYTGAPEPCNRIDNDCSTGGGTAAAEDADLDMHAPIAASCSGGYPTDDCDDARASTYPGAPEGCDPFDSDCDGDVNDVTAGICGPVASCTALACRADDEVAVGGGDYAFGCARRGGAVYCWGDRTPMPDGTFVGLDGATQIPGISDAVDITAGREHVCVRRATGAIVCWGANDQCQLGDGVGSDPQSALVTVAGGITDWVEVAAGTRTTCARRASGQVLCWGDNEAGQLGIGVPSMTCQPTPTPLPRLTNAVQITGSEAHMCARRVDGTAACWGTNYGQIGDGTTNPAYEPTTVVGLSNVIQIGAGGYGTCAITGSGAAYCWGENSFGQLGNGTTDPSNVPVAVTGLTDAAEISVGFYARCARRTSGAVVCWGMSSSGAIGELASETPRLTPGPVPGIADAVEIDIGGFSGSMATCARRATGEIVCWGRLHTSLARQPVYTLANAAELVAGSNHNCVRTTAGGMRCWGLDSSGQLGDGPGWTAYGVPVAPAGMSSGVTAISAGYGSCAVQGRAYCWGVYTGDGTPETRETPVAVSTLPATGVIGIASMNITTSFAWTASSSWAWHTNNYGQFGDGTTSPSLVFTPVETFLAVRSISAGHNNACAIGTDNLVRCWGANNAGEVGDGTSAMRTTPTLVSGLGTMAEVVTPAGGGNHACARTSAGAVSCWGINNAGQLGDGTTDQHSTPVAVSGLTGAIDLSAGAQHTCAVRGDGSVWCWGRNAEGQIGDGTRTDRLVPTRVLNIADAVQVACGGLHTCARRSTGAVVCWGSNGSGQYGLGSLGGSAFPSAVYGLP